MKVHCPYDELVAIENLKPHTMNLNRHPKDQIERLAKILKYQGVRYPAKVSNQSGLLTAGHGRIEAAKLIGWTHFPVSFQDYESQDQEIADLHADNQIASWAEFDFSGLNMQVPEFGPDFDVDMFGVKNFEIDVADKEGLCDEDEVPERVEPKTKLGDIYQLGQHRLMCGDSTSIDAVEKLMDGQKAELCFTSPPYADQRDYNGGKELSTEHLASFIRTSHGSVSYFAVNLGYSRKDGEVNQYWDDYIKEAKSCGLKLLSWNVWDRSGSGYTIGQATAMFAIEHEFVFVFGNKTKDLNRTVENKNRDISKKSTIRNKSGDTRGTFGTVGSHRQLGTVFRSDIARYTGEEHHRHPAMFPVVFPEAYIEAMTDTTDPVYEPFGGSGSTLIACEKTNRKCFMMELDPHYCDVIVARWEKFTGQKAKPLTQSSDNAAMENHG